ncbi:FMN-dependent alpha-hydroxy acid dehydrogenase [Striga asiatica]|uniref:FMN-dependent alpha-hydroxy acid dehydrogenase n=1 Tax=Striga asiatica TaxID=4170 RepID=A0A5A7Q5S1_STRAF|nr:FMN-dependent alpha-hydroxy acid dehydrogenase [Striga asiatica]
MRSVCLRLCSKLLYVMTEGWISKSFISERMARASWTMPVLEYTNASMSHTVWLEAHPTKFSRRSLQNESAFESRKGRVTFFFEHPLKMAPESARTLLSGQQMGDDELCVPRVADAEHVL